MIGIFWTRLGTKTDDADSGTVEEIQRFLDAGKPTHLFFSDLPAAVGTIDTDQLSRLNDYKASLQREGLLGSFSTGEDLAKQVGVVLTNDVREGAVLSPRAEPNKPDTPRLEITSQKSGSGFAVTVSNQGTSEATRVSVSLEGGLFMLNAAHERIGSGFKDSDEIGSLTPEARCSYNVMTAAQTATPRVRVSCAESDAVEVELS